MASVTAYQVAAGTRSRSNNAVKTGVSTTYVPVMNPETEASV